MNRTPNLEMLKPATEFAENIAKQAEAFFDISHYGPDSTAAVIAALLRTYKILSERFKRYAYR